MKKIVLLLVFFSATLIAEINLEIVEESNSCKVLIINNSNIEMPLNGYRLIAPDTAWDSITSDLDLYISYYNDTTYDGIIFEDKYFHQVNFKYPYEAIIAPGDTISVNYHYSNFFVPPYVYSMGAMLDGFQYPVILKTLLNNYDRSDYSKISINDLNTITADANYYNVNFRYHDFCGNETGGLFDTFKGKTQILLPLSDSIFRISLTDVTFEPNNGDIMYWMTLAMGQEFFGVDMQYMIAQGMKETFAATGPTDNYIETVGTGVYGPFQVEDPTAHSRMLAYKDLFPESKQLLNGFYNAKSFLAKNSKLTNSYFVNSTFPLSSPEIISAYIFSMVCNLYVDEALNNCTEFEWDSLCENSTDSLLRINAILASYNVGIFGAGTTIAKNIIDNYSWFLTNSSASDSFPPGNFNYREDIITAIKHLEKISGQSVVDTSIGIYDEKITLNNLQEFLFGEDGSAESPATTGGLCKHFTFNQSKVWSDVITAFNLLKGKAPSTSGEEVISFRYDFLTILRVVAFNLAIDAHFYGDADALQFTEKFSTNFDSKDLIPPTILYDSPTYYGSRYCKVYCRLYDNEALYSLQYSDTSNWLNIYNSSNPILYHENNIIIEQEFDKIVSPSNPAWFFAADTSGNCTISRTEFSNTSNKDNIKINNLDMNVFKLNNYIKINLAKPSSSLNIKIHDLKGRLVRRFNVKDCRDIRISTKGLSKGLYLFNLESNNSSKTFKINISK